MKKQLLFISLLLSLLHLHCAKQQYQLPAELMTAEATAITTSGAQVAGMVKLNGNNVVAYGHCWSSINDVPDLTIREGLTELDEPLQAVDTFFSAISGLNSNRTYYVRAYLITNADTVYGNSISLRTGTVAVERWAQVNYAAGQPIPAARSGAISFVIGGNLYTGGGFTSTAQLDDFWQFNFATRTWTRKTDIKGFDLVGTISFSIGNKGYLAFGYSSNNDVDQLNYSRSIYEYDPATDTWSLKGTIAYQRAFSAVAVYNNKAYISGGYGGANQAHQNTLLEYDPVSNTTVARAVMPAAIQNHFSYAAGGRIYAGGGILQNGESSLKFYEYNPATNTWATRADLPRQSEGGGAFVIGNAGYMITGFDQPSGGGAITMNRFNAAQNSWQRRLNFPDLGRYYANILSYNGKGYVVFGVSGIRATTLYNTMYEYTPD